MKTFLLIILTGLLVTNLGAQVSFSPVECKLKTLRSNKSTDLLCSSSTMSVKFQIQRMVTVLQQNNFVSIDSQAIQITPLKFTGYQKGSSKLSVNSEKELLDAYSKYELAYFKNDLGIEV